MVEHTVKSFENEISQLRGLIAEMEKGGALRDARGLLHRMGDDDDGIVFASSKSACVIVV